MQLFSNTLVVVSALFTKIFLATVASLYHHQCLLNKTTCIFQLALKLALA